MQPFIAVPCIAALLFRAYRSKSLTLLALVTAAVTATIHALHPSALPFTLLGVFFLLGTQATKVKHDVKSGITLSSSGHAGGEGSRTTIQVLANSGCASVLCLAHIFRYGIGAKLSCVGEDGISDLLLVGIVCNYLAVTADTLSSELGILAKQQPRLITQPWKTVPRGTNGGVTLRGVGYGWVGSLVIGLTSVLLIPFCKLESKAGAVLQTTKGRPYSLSEKAVLAFAFSIWGAIGSLLDSLLGAVLQASVIDKKTGKIVEGTGGIKVLLQSTPREPPYQGKPAVLKDAKTGKEVKLEPKHERKHSREISSGRDLLDNNQINLLMASTMSIWGMAVAATI